MDVFRVEIGEMSSPVLWDFELRGFGALEGLYVAKELVGLDRISNPEVCSDFYPILTSNLHVLFKGLSHSST